MKALLAISIVSAFLFSGCSNAANYAPPGAPTMELPQTQSVAAASGDASVLAALTREFTIGSTVDPINGDFNPYGLDIAKATAGRIGAGDLVVCNFNNITGVEGTGASIVALRPVVGSGPRPIAGNKALTGCTELALSPNSIIWATAFSQNAVPVFAPTGALIRNSYSTFDHPFGITFANHATSLGVAAFYESNAGDGSIVRISVTSTGRAFFETIATGFAVNHGAPGNIFGPSGLQYDAANDRLFIVDGANNSLVRFDKVTTIRPGGIHVTGTSFTGVDATHAHLLFIGPPLNGPISSALLPGGHIAVGNTLDPDGKNLMIEFTADGAMLFVKNVDPGPAGAIFGMVATGTSTATTRLFFNDDNDNTVKLLQ